MALPEAKFEWFDEYGNLSTVHADLITVFDEVSAARNVLQPTLGAGVGVFNEEATKRPIVVQRPAQAATGTLEALFVQSHNGLTAAQRALYLREAFATGTPVKLTWNGWSDEFKEVPAWSSNNQFIAVGDTHLQRDQRQRRMWRVTTTYVRSS